MKTADERMPTDLACADHRPQVRGIHDLCTTPGTNSDTITEEPEEMQVEDPGKMVESRFSRGDKTRAFRNKLHAVVKTLEHSCLSVTVKPHLIAVFLLVLFRKELFCKFIKLCTTKVSHSNVSFPYFL